MQGRLRVRLVSSLDLEPSGENPSTLRTLSTTDKDLAARWPLQAAKPDSVTAPGAPVIPTCKGGVGRPAPVATGGVPLDLTGVLRLMGVRSSTDVPPPTGVVRVDDPAGAGAPIVRSGPTC